VFPWFLVSHLIPPSPVTYRIAFTDALGYAVDRWNTSREALPDHLVRPPVFFCRLFPHLSHAFSLYSHLLVSLYDVHTSPEWEYAGTCIPSCCPSRGISPALVHIDICFF
ncbi:hypothetical protein PISMIDRAFT_686981, partial [Pisolithus microcarpus 441]